MNFTDQDINQIKDKGLTKEGVEAQIELFKSGIPFTNIVEAATINNGITKLDDTLINESIDLFESKKNGLSLLKFVPASGAATRMFKFLFQFLEEYNAEKTDANYKNENINTFVKGLNKFPFYNQVLEKLEAKGVVFSELNEVEKAYHFVQTVLNQNDLNFGNWPKGLLPFHKYSDGDISTAFEEHLYETALYTGKDKQANLHFTISEKHEEKFKNEFNRIKNEVEKNTRIKFNISFSYQQQSTDTIAVTPDDQPFRNDNDSILFLSLIHI